MTPINASTKSEYNHYNRAQPAAAGQLAGHLAGHQAGFQLDSRAAAALPARPKPVSAAQPLPRPAVRKLADQSPLRQTTVAPIIKNFFPPERRGIPASPRKCIGKKVKFTPVNIIKNSIFNHLGFIVKPTINGYQLMKAPIKANTAPILKT